MRPRGCRLPYETFDVHLAGCCCEGQAERFVHSTLAQLRLRRRGRCDHWRKPDACTEDERRTC